MITTETREFLIGHPHIKELHFTEDGSYHLRTVEFEGSKYTRLDFPKKALQANKIVLTISREEALAETQVVTPIAEPIIVQQETQVVTPKRTRNGSK
jgi:hypothetical protein